MEEIEDYLSESMMKEVEKSIGNLSLYNIDDTMEDIHKDIVSIIRISTEHSNAEMLVPVYEMLDNVKKDIQIYLEQLSMSMNKK